MIPIRIHRPSQPHNHCSVLLLPRYWPMHAQSTIINHWNQMATIQRDRESLSADNLQTFASSGRLVQRSSTVEYGCGFPWHVHVPPSTRHGNINSGAVLSSSCPERYMYVRGHVIIVDYKVHYEVSLAAQGNYLTFAIAGSQRQTLGQVTSLTHHTYRWFSDGCRRVLALVIVARYRPFTRWRWLGADESLFASIR